MVHLFLSLLFVSHKTWVVHCSNLLYLCAAMRLKVTATLISTIFLNVTLKEEYFLVNIYFVYDCNVS